MPIPENDYIISQDANDQFVAYDVRNKEPLIPPNGQPDPVFQAVLQQASVGDVYVASGEYKFSNNFAGLTLPSLIRLTLSPRAVLTVKNNYAGSVFIFKSDANIGVMESEVRGG